MKTKLFISVFFLFCFFSFKAQPPFWKLNGNPAIGPDAVNNTNNLFGTSAPNNIPVRFGTNGINRMKLNQNVSYGVNGINNPRNGFLLLGADNNFTGGTLYNNGGAYSLLHLSSGVGGFAQEGGFRNWMRFGITSTHNQDLLFIGQRATTGALDVTDAVIGWADNAGQDNLVFNFLNGPDGVAGNDLVGNNNLGREILRLTASGNIGVGPRFNNTFAPTSTLHQHQENFASSWMQITNQTMATAGTQTGPTSIAATNGLRWGILGDATQQRNGNAFIYNQETRHLILSTGHPVPSTLSAPTNERLRITSFNAPTFSPNGAYGVYIPSGSTNTANTDLTRVAISHNPSSPVTRPLSLLHLGYNAGATPATNLDGWRPWMEIGTFTNSDVGTSMYSGIKLFGNGGSDAVLGWGYTPFTSSANSQSRMRFVFTQTTSGTNVAAGINGIEAAHFWSDGNNTRMGVGDMQTTNTDPLNTLEIMSSSSSPYFGSGNGSSGLKFRNLNATNTPMANVGNQGVLALDSIGNVIYVKGGTGGIGNICGGTQVPLTNDWEVPLKNHTFTFSDPSGTLPVGVNSVRIGASCGNPVYPKLEVTRNPSSNIGSYNLLIGVYSANHDVFPVINSANKSIAGAFLADAGFNGSTTTNLQTMEFMVQLPTQDIIMAAVS